MAGNYGGSSIPTTPIAAANIGNAEYTNWECTTAVGGTSFVYKGVVILTSTGPVEMVIKPWLVGAIVGSNLVFLCYDCSCAGAMTGATSASSVTYTGSPMYAPTIIGGGGLNS